MLPSMGSQRVRHDWATEQQQKEKGRAWLWSLMRLPMAPSTLMKQLHLCPRCRGIVLNDKHWMNVLGVSFSWRQEGLPSDSGKKNLPAIAGDMQVWSWVKKSPGEGSGNPLRYSCLVNPRDQGTWQATVHGVTKSGALLEWLNWMENLFEINW